jgi:hypothetical protein
MPPECSPARARREPRPLLVLRVRFTNPLEQVLRESGRVGPGEWARDRGAVRPVQEIPVEREQSDVEPGTAEGDDANWLRGVVGYCGSFVAIRSWGRRFAVSWDTATHPG